VIITRKMGSVSTVKTDARMKCSMTKRHPAQRLALTNVRRTAFKEQTKAALSARTAAQMKALSKMATLAFPLVLASTTRVLRSSMACV